MTTAVHINARQMSVNEATRSYIEKKASRLDHYLPDIKDVYVDLVNNETARSSQDRQVAQLTVRIRGKFLRAEERSNDIRAAFDLAIDKLQNQVEHYKGKNRENYRKPGQPSIGDVLAMEAQQMNQTQPDLNPVVRHKKFSITAMTEEEALEQMQLLGHDNFFIFLNSETHIVNILYHRKDGTYGIIEPEIG